MASSISSEFLSLVGSFEKYTKISLIIDKAQVRCYLDSQASTVDVLSQKSEPPPPTKKTGQ